MDESWTIAIPVVSLCKGCFVEKFSTSYRDSLIKITFCTCCLFLLGDKCTKFSYLKKIICKNSF
ncbi:hypothetical protein C3V44_00510 [Capnocytophaga sp. oral taxon 864]|nr:hypothetical protein C3V44_00510 [Capnocytophaga sp. oral taxon 864]